METQTIIALLVVAAAVAYAARRMWRMVRPAVGRRGDGDGGSGCGSSGCGCG